MKRTTTVIVLVAIVVVFSAALYYLWKKNQEDPITYTTQKASTETIVVNTVATGSIVPEEESNATTLQSPPRWTAHGDSFRKKKCTTSFLIKPHVISTTYGKQRYKDAYTAYKSKIGRPLPVPPRLPSVNAGVVFGLKAPSKTEVDPVLIR